MKLPNRQPGSYPHVILRESDFRPGLLWQFPRTRLETNFHALYNLEYDSLFNGKANDINGLTFVEENKDDIIQIPGFKTVTEFFIDALFAQPPMGFPLEFLDSVVGATRWASITGTGVLVSEPGLIYFTDTNCWFPIFSEGAPYPIGAAIAYSYNANSSNPVTRANIADTIDIHLWVEGKAAVKRTYAFTNQGALGALMNEEASAIVGVTTFGQGFSDYSDITHLLRELMMRYTLQARVLNRHSSPHLQGPVGFDGGAPTYEKEGMYLPLADKDDPEYKYLEISGNPAAHQAHIDNITQELHIATGLPAAAFGIERHGASGIALERQSFKAISKIRSLRRMIGTALVEALTAAGIQVSELIWPDDVFATWTEKVSTEMGLVTSGISTAEDSHMRLFGQTTQGRSPEPQNQS